MKQNFYVWNWVGGGYNQTYANNAHEALLEAKKTWPDGVVDMKTFRCLDYQAEKAYWREFPSMD